MWGLQGRGGWSGEASLVKKVQWLYIHVYTRCVESHTLYLERSYTHVCTCTVLSSVCVHQIEPLVTVLCEYRHVTCKCCEGPTAVCAFWHKLYRMTLVNEALDAYPACWIQGSPYQRCLLLALRYGFCISA